VPTYAYACKDCDHRFEVVQAFTDDSLTVCPECGGNLRKVFNSVGVVFKGGGFYRTDSRGSSTSTVSGDSGSSGSGGSGSGSGSAGSSSTSGSASYGSTGSGSSSSGSAASSSSTSSPSSSAS
jgi:putative FmdB family regulatory protein